MGEVHFDSTAAPSGDTLNSETLFACKQLGITPQKVCRADLIGSCCGVCVNKDTTRNLHRNSAVRSG